MKGPCGAGLRDACEDRRVWSIQSMAQAWLENYETQPRLEPNSWCHSSAALVELKEHNQALEKWQLMTNPKFHLQFF